MIRLCHQIIHYDLKKTYYKVTIAEKIKTIDKKIKQNKDQYDLDRQTPKISGLSSGNVVNMHFRLAEMFYQQKACWKSCYNKKI